MREQAESDGDFKLCIRQLCAVDVDGPRGDADRRGEENKSTPDDTKATFSSVGFPFLKCGVGLGQKEKKRNIMAFEGA